jgi:hypothetical protein
MMTATEFEFLGDLEDEFEHEAMELEPFFPLNVARQVIKRDLPEVGWTETCKSFFKAYELSFNPDSVTFGIDNNPDMTLDDKENRKKDINAVIYPLKQRLLARAAAALNNKVPASFPALPKSVKDTVLRLSFLQFSLFRKWFPDGNWVRFLPFDRCFERFANGELRDPSKTGHPGFGEPDSAVYFVFAEFAFLCIELGYHRSLWEEALRTFVKTQEIFMHVYRKNPKSPPPAVGAAFSALATPRSLKDFHFTYFKQIGSSVTMGEGQSDLKRKAALRAKYAGMGVSMLEVAARDNLRRAQLMK